MDISAPATSLADRPRAGQLGHQCSHAPGRPNLHLVSSSRRPRREGNSITRERSRSSRKPSECVVLLPYPLGPVTYCRTDRRPPAARAGPALRSWPQPAGPVVFGQSVLDRHDGIAVNPARDTTRSSPRPNSDPPLLFLNTYAPSSETPRRRRRGRSRMLAGLVAGTVDRCHDEVHRRLVVRQIGCEAAFVAHAVSASAYEHLLQRVEDLDAHAKRVAGTTRRRAA